MPVPAEPSRFTFKIGRALADCAIVSWDSDAFGFPVASIDRIILGAESDNVSLLRAMESWRLGIGARLMSCRLDHRQLKESMALEAIGFRFVEYVLRPRLQLRAAAAEPDPDIWVGPAVTREVDEVAAIAERSFETGRFAVDWRVPPHLSGRRYAAWVRSSIGHPSQRLHVARVGSEVVGFFITEADTHGGVYWHLTAVAPRWQGKGIGRRLWESMLRLHGAEGANAVETRISGHNPRVLNLYAKLGFSFQAPEMTLHWVTSDGLGSSGADPG